MAVNGNQKGKRGEREAVKALHAWGFPDARRTQQYNGEGKSDVVCEESLPGLHIEVKRTSEIDFKVGSQRLTDACVQAATDAKGSPWVVLWRPNKSRWWHATTDIKGMLATFAGDHDIPELLTILARRPGRPNPENGG